MPLLSPLSADPTAPDAAPVRDRILVQAGLLTAAISLILDQATKRVAEVELVRNRAVPVVADVFGWQLIYNPGGAFGFPAPSWFFLIVTLIVGVIVARNLPLVGRPTQAFAYGLLLAGALGNALDRVFRVGDAGDPRFLHGHVVDFIAVRLPFYGEFPRFNIADVSITLGFVLLLLSLWAEDRQTPEST